MSKLNNKKRGINTNIQITLSKGVSKGYIIRCAHLQKRNVALTKKYSKGRHLKFLRRVTKSNVPLSSSLPQAFVVTVEDLKNISIQ